MSKKPAAPKPQAESNPPGRPPYEPTERDKGRVEAWTIAGYGQTDIAARLEISEPTLRAHYREQLDFGKMDFLAAVSNSLGIMAIGAPAVYDTAGQMLRAEVVRQPAPAIFIMKTQGKKLGWSERHAGAGPLNPEDVDWSQYTDAELELIARAQQLLTSRAAPPALSGPGAGTKAH